MDIREYFDRIDSTMKEIFRYDSDKMRNISSDLSLTVENIGGFLPQKIALAYVHKGWACHSADFINMEHMEYGSSEWNLIKSLNSYPNGLIRNSIDNLPRQSGLAKRNYNHFSYNIKTLIPRPNLKLNHNSPIISLIVIGAVDEYPYNKQGESIRALKDLSKIGAAIVHDGLNRNPLVAPYWIKSSFAFDKGNINPRGFGIENLDFISALHSCKR